MANSARIKVDQAESSMLFCYYRVQEDTSRILKIKFLKPEFFRDQNSGTILVFIIWDLVLFYDFVDENEINTLLQVLSVF